MVCSPGTISDIKEICIGAKGKKQKQYFVITVLLGELGLSCRSTGRSGEVCINETG
jgi:hypothetical protein